MAQAQRPIAERAGCNGILVLLCLLAATPVTAADPPELGLHPTTAPPAKVRAAWDSLISVQEQDDPVKQQRVTASVERMLSTRYGGALVLDLATLLTARKQPRIIVSFVDSLPSGGDDVDGYMRPPTPAAEQYEVFIWIYPEREDNTRSSILYGQFPGNAMCDIVFWYTEPTSSMAQTLYHELLHVWFINRYADEERTYPTGHGELRSCELDEEFMALLAVHARELDELEGRRPEPPVRGWISPDYDEQERLDEEEPDPPRPPSRRPPPQWPMRRRR